MSAPQADVPRVPPATHGELMTEKEAADLLKVSQRTLYSHRKAGRLKPIRIGRCIRYERQTLMDVLFAGGLTMKTEQA